MKSLIPEISDYLFNNTLSPRSFCDAAAYWIISTVLGHTILSYEARETPAKLIVCVCSASGITSRSTLLEKANGIVQSVLRMKYGKETIKLKNDVLLPPASLTRCTFQGSLEGILDRIGNAIIDNEDGTYDFKPSVSYVIDGEFGKTLQELNAKGYSTGIISFYSQNYTNEDYSPLYSQRDAKKGTMPLRDIPGQTHLTVLAGMQDPTWKTNAYISPSHVTQGFVRRILMIRRIDMRENIPPRLIGEHDIENSKRFEKIVCQLAERLAYLEKYLKYAPLGATPHRFYRRRHIQATFDLMLGPVVNDLFDANYKADVLFAEKQNPLTGLQVGTIDTCIRLAMNVALSDVDCLISSEPYRTSDWVDDASIPQEDDPIAIEPPTQLKIPYLNITKEHWDFAYNGLFKVYKEDFEDMVRQILDRAIIKEDVIRDTTLAVGSLQGYVLQRELRDKLKDGVTRKELTDKNVLGRKYHAALADATLQGILKVVQVSFKSGTGGAPSWHIFTDRANSPSNDFINNLLTTRPDLEVKVLTGQQVANVMSQK